jgi:predicted Zn-dependent protease
VPAYYLGLVGYGTKNYQEGVAAFTEYFRRAEILKEKSGLLAEYYDQAALFQARCFNSLDQMAAADSILMKFDAEFPARPVFVLLLLKMYLAKGDVQKAAFYLEDFSKRFPQHPEFRSLNEQFSELSNQ